MGALQSLVFDRDRQDEEVNTDPGDPAAARLVRAMLSELGLPSELVLDIMDLAEYYSSVHAARSDVVKIRADAHTRRDFCSSLLYLVSPAIRSGALEGESWRMKKVTWTVEGHDQGWGGEHPGSFHGAYSWYEACIFRPLYPKDIEDEAVNLDMPLEADLYRKPADCQDRLRNIGWTLVPNGDDVVWRLQNNRVARRDFETHTIEWTVGRVIDAEDADERGCGDGAGFLDALRPGDRVGLWARALYSGWENHVKAAEVNVVYEVR